MALKPETTKKIFEFVQTSFPHTLSVTHNLFVTKCFHTSLVQESCEHNRAHTALSGASTHIASTHILLCPLLSFTHSSVTLCFSATILSHSGVEICQRVTHDLFTHSVVTNEICQIALTRTTHGDVLCVPKLRPRWCVTELWAKKSVCVSTMVCGNVGHDNLHRKEKVCAK